MSLSDQIIGAESGGRLNARNSRSSAFGPGQFLDGTWLSLIQKYRPDLASLPRDQQLALRSDPGLSKQMVDAYAQENGRTLTSAGFQASPGNTYLAHFAGPGGAVKVLQSPNASAADTLGPDVVKANPFLANMTNSQLAAWAAQRVGSQPDPRNGLTAPPISAQAPLSPQPPASFNFANFPTMTPQAPSGGPMALFSPQPQQQAPQPQAQSPGNAAAPSFWSMLQPPSDPTAVANWWARQAPTG